MILVRNKGRYPVAMGGVLCFPGELVVNINYEDVKNTRYPDFIEVVDLSIKPTATDIVPPVTVTPTVTVTPVSPVVTDTPISQVVVEPVKGQPNIQVIPVVLDGATPLSAGVANESVVAEAVVPSEPISNVSKTDMKETNKDKAAESLHKKFNKTKK
jgi:CBS domain-containing protein